MRIALLAIISCISFIVSGQTKEIVLLKQKVDAAKSDHEKLTAIVAYCEDYSNIPQDSLDKYAYIAISLAENLQDEHLKSLALITMAQNYMQWGWTDSVHVIIDNELPKLSHNDESTRDIYFRYNKLKAVAFGAEGRFQESLEILYPLEAKAEHYKDSLLAAGLSNMIGSIATARSEWVEARKWNDKAIALQSGSKNKYLGSAYVSRAQLMYQLDKMDSCLFFLEKGINWCRKIEMLDRLAGAYRFQSAVFTELNRLGEAETALKNMQAARNKIYNNPDAIIEDNIQIADFYANTGQLKKAIAYCWSKLESGDYHQRKSGTEIKSYNNDPATRLPFFLALSRYLKEDEDFDAYQQVLEEIIILKDTLSEINKSEAIAEIQTKYNVEQKENTIIKQQLQLTRRNYLLYGSLIFIMMAAVIVWLWQHNERIKQKTTMQNAIENEKRQSALAILQAEEKERKRIAADLHDNIGAYASAISADVDKITNKGLQDGGEQLQNLRHHSNEIINSLRDTIWVLNKENITVTGIGDRIKNYVQKLMPSYEHIYIEVEEHIQNDVQVGSQKALSIFRIMQEAIHNAIKHSNSKNILIEISSKDSISILIKDYGQGMPEAINGAGTGLRNMKSRAAEAGISLTVNSSESGGTAVIIQTTTN